MDGLSGKKIFQKLPLSLKAGLVGPLSALFRTLRSLKINTLQKPGGTRFPETILMEASALCNISCKGCALHGPDACADRPLGLMKKGVWEPVLREIGSWGKTVGVTFHGGGEPLMNPELRDMLALGASFPNIKTGFLTNGMLLDREWAQFLTRSRLDWIGFSVDGIMPETHAGIRQRSDLNLIERHIETLLSLRKRNPTHQPQVLLNMVAYDEILDQTERFVEKWLPKVDRVMVSDYRHPPENRKSSHVTMKRRPCHHLWSQMVISWDGRLGLCCEDFNIDHSPGRIGEADLLTLWRSPEYRNYRSAHLSRRFDDPAICRNCDVWAEPYSGVVSVYRDQYFRLKTPFQTIYLK